MELLSTTSLSQKTPTITPMLLTEEEAAAYTSFSRSFLRKCRMTGAAQNGIPQPKFIKIGKRAIRYLKSDLDEWISNFQRVEHLAALEN